jgi:ABC-type enterochelin transport system permease subunit
MDSGNEWGWHMDAIGLLKSWIGALTDIGLMLLALAIVAALLVGGTLPFFGGVVGNIIDMVKSLGNNGLVGLIALGLIMWLFSARRVA